VQAVLEQLHKSQDLGVCNGASALKLVSALWVMSLCGCGSEIVRQPRKVRVRRWKSIPKDGRRESELGRLSSCYTELQTVWIGDISSANFNYVFWDSPRLYSHTIPLERDSIIFLCCGSAPIAIVGYFLPDIQKNYVYRKQSPCESLFLLIIGFVGRSIVVRYPSHINNSSSFDRMHYFICRTSIITDTGNW
jgi:hypothetical protein